VNSISEVKVLKDTRYFDVCTTSARNYRLYSESPDSAQVWSDNIKKLKKDLAVGLTRTDSMDAMRMRMDEDPHASAAWHSLQELKVELEAHEEAVDKAYRILEADPDAVHES